jgi:hypothetical protein
VSDEPDTTAQPTVRSRVLACGITPERLALHHEAKRVLLDGEVVDDLDTITEPGSRIYFGPS